MLPFLPTASILCVIVVHSDSISGVVEEGLTSDAKVIGSNPDRTIIDYSDFYSHCSATGRNGIKPITIYSTSKTYVLSNGDGKHYTPLTEYLMT